MKSLAKGWMLAAWLAASAMAGAGTQTVEISKFAFTPKALTVAPGTKVAWINHDEIPHTVSARDKAFTSKALDTDDRYEHVFDKEGDYAYFCAVHPYMTGVVHVRKP
ncbi:cupredoxin family copper-binding protein [Chromobacterium violaceum]|uniref:cupredoxin domain-containing protein n=1 Tax=Chromobacterium violaceum TaxID=536 RepID=UPI001B343B86|nr:cupredoxin family copper-binding protein [Chromobacterium violaceum]MBP4048388.1 cupredoxin family copper-binding protein [Chromobacterium violaceum]